ncbi:hypothetical protein [Phenylobacterium sp.]|uniref:hypothetical protein n=1 Tax=Phenylobacterium sp. TaxID=1871053 RepID=UPI00374D839A
MQDDEALSADEPVRDIAEAAPAEDDGDGTFDLELDGQVHTLPAALKGAFLRQADYTRKTQELAHHRRGLEAEREAVAAHAQAVGQASGEQVHLAALDHQLEHLGGVDWQAYAAEDPHGAQALWDRLQQMAHAREGLAQTIGQRAAHGRLQAAHAAAARMAEAGRTLQKEIDGWSPELAAKLVDYAQTHGVTLEELSQQDDPRVWKILHRAHQAEMAGQREGAARTAAQAQAVRPAVLVSGSAAGGGGVRDELGTKEWMQRRNDLVRKGR